MAILKKCKAVCDGTDCTNEQEFWSVTGRPGDIGNGWTYSQVDYNTESPKLQTFCAEADCQAERDALQSTAMAARAARLDPEE